MSAFFSVPGVCVEILTVHFSHGIRQKTPAIPQWMTGSAVPAEARYFQGVDIRRSTCRMGNTRRPDAIN